MAEFTEAYIDGLVQERCNSSALAMELHLPCTNPSTCITQFFWVKLYLLLHCTFNSAFIGCILLYVIDDIVSSILRWDYMDTQVHNCGKKNIGTI